LRNSAAALAMQQVIVTTDADDEGPQVTNIDDIVAILDDLDFQEELRDPDTYAMIVEKAGGVE
jgi:hypothetical protein